MGTIFILYHHFLTHFRPPPSHPICYQMVSGLRKNKLWWVMGQKSLLMPWWGQDMAVRVFWDSCASQYRENNRCHFWKGSCIEVWLKAWGHWTAVILALPFPLVFFMANNKRWWRMCSFTWTLQQWNGRTSGEGGTFDFSPLAARLSVCLLSSTTTMSFCFSGMNGPTREGGVCFFPCQSVHLPGSQYHLNIHKQCLQAIDQEYLDKDVCATTPSLSNSSSCQ